MELMEMSQLFDHSRKTDLKTTTSLAYQPAIAAWFKAIGHWFTETFNLQSVSCEPEIQVCQTFDRTGSLWWYAVNPVTGQSAWLESSDEAQSWIEQIHASRFCPQHTPWW